MPQSLETPTCASCRFFSGSSATYRADCHRHAPALVKYTIQVNNGNDTLLPFEETRTVWPTVEGHNFCGDHQPRTNHENQPT